MNEQMTHFINFISLVVKGDRPQFRFSMTQTRLITQTEFQSASQYDVRDSFLFYLSITSLFLEAETVLKAQVFSSQFSICLQITWVKVVRCRLLPSGLGQDLKTLLSKISGIAVGPRTSVSMKAGLPPSCGRVTQEAERSR